MSEWMSFGSQSLQVVLQLSLHATGIVFVVLLVQFALGSKLSARARYALWGILVARLLIYPGTTKCLC
jgi:beta-lactamase regulating signal transducer with metallopeptidase domain